MNHDHHHEQTSSNMSSMEMYFHYGYENQFLFEHFHIDSPFKIWAVCGVLFVLSVIFEAIKYARCVQCGCQATKMSCSSNEVGDIQDNDTHVRLARNCYVGKLRTKRHRLIQTMLHTAQTSLGLLLMLSAMSFNICLIFAIVTGTGVGYFVFYRPYNEVEALDSCH